MNANEELKAPEVAYAALTNEEFQGVRAEINSLAAQIVATRNNGRTDLFEEKFRALFPAVVGIELAHWEHEVSRRK